MNDNISSNAKANPQMAVARDILLSSRGRLSWEEAEEIAKVQQDHRKALKAESDRRCMELFGPGSKQPPSTEKVLEFYQWQRENNI